MDSTQRTDTTMADETDVATREAKEAFIDSKMEKIRQRNRELHQRYLEIEADKQNAEENSNAALAKQLAQDGTVEKMPQRIAKSTTPKARKIKPDSSSGGNIQGPSPPSANANDLSRRQQRLSEDENPPPDPSYNFLFDRLRVGNESDEQRIQSRRHPSNYGGQDFSNVKNTMQIRKRHEREHPRGPPRTKMEMTLTMTGHERTQYEEWKRVQDQCDKERLARQKTASGEWRREWDRDKIIQDDDNDVWRRPNGPRGGGRGGGDGGGDHRGGRGGNRGCLFARGGRDRGRGGRGGNNGGEMSPFPSRGGRGRGRGPRRPPANKRYSDSSSDADMARSPTDRKVNIGRDFLQIRVNNEFVASSETQSNQQQQQQQFPETRPAQQRPRRVGSGRVLSASSQSEDEKGVEDQYSPRSDAIKEGVDEVKVIVKMDDLGKETEGSVDESVGDESWEDLTTSGNESQDLSCPTDEGNEKDEVESVKEIDEVFDEVVDKTDGNVEVKEGNSINVENVSSLPEENGISVGGDDLEKKNDGKVDEVVIETSLEIADVKIEPDNVMKREKLEENDAQIMSEVAEAVSDVEIESKLMEKKTKIQSNLEENDAQIESKTKANNSQFVSDIVENNSQVESEIENNSKIESEIVESNSQVESKIVENNSKIESEIENNSKIESEIVESNSQVESKIVENNSKIESEIENNSKIESEIVENNSKIESEIENNSKIDSEIVENNSKIESKMAGSDSVDEENKPEAKSTIYENNDSKQEFKTEENHSEEPLNLEKPSNEISIEAVASKENESFKVTNDKMDHDDKTDSIDATNASIEVEKLD